MQTALNDDNEQRVLSADSSHSAFTLSAKHFDLHGVRLRCTQEHSGLDVVYASPTSLLADGLSSRSWNVSVPDNFRRFAVCGRTHRFSGQLHAGARFSPHVRSEDFFYRIKTPAVQARISTFVTGSISRNATRRYLSYSEADLRFFAPEVRHVAPMGVKFGVGVRSRPPRQISPHRCNG